MPHPIHPVEQSHAEVEELLPWYATGQLDPEDRSVVEQHLITCARCQQALVLERRLIDEFRRVTPEIETGWARLRTRIGTPAPVKLLRPGLIANLWADLSRPAIVGIVAVQLALVIAGGAAVLSLSRPQYHALSSKPATAKADIIIIFRADATEEDVRNVLKSAGASIVGGPTSANAYLLHVANAQRQAALAKLRSDHNVQMAEPIDGVGS